MSEKETAVRERLADHLQDVGVDLVRRGLPAESVFEAMLTVGLAGSVGLHGKNATALKLLAIANDLSGQVRAEAQAISEAEGSTKN